MTEGYHANNKKTPQGVANVEAILFNHLMQERWKRANRAMERANRAMERANRAMERILFFLLNGKPKDLQLMDYCHELC
jgi:hypothetical protein